MSADLLLLLSLAVTEFWMEATKASFSCSLGMDPANSPNRHSKRDCKDPPEKEFCIPTLDNFWAKISYFETTSLASLLCKESLCNWFFWPRNCVNGSNKTFKMYTQYGTTSLPLHGYRNRHRSRFSKKKLCLLAPTITMTLVREGSFCTILGPNFGNASVLWFAEMHWWQSSSTNIYVALQGFGGPFPV